MNLTGFGSVKPVFCPFCGCAQDEARSKPALYQRADDKEETIRHRLEVFRKKTLPAATRPTTLDGAWSPWPSPPPWRRGRKP